MVKMSKVLTIAVILAGIAVLAALAIINTCPNCRSNSALGLIENNEVGRGELIIHLNADNFNTTIADGVSLVDFWAPRCGPCRMQGPILEKVAESVDGQAKITKLNVDEAGGVAGRFGVQSIPTLILFKDGNEIRRFVGVQSHDTLIEAIDKLKQRG